jgi:hypothetical protein
LGVGRAIIWTALTIAELLRDSLDANSKDRRRDRKRANGNRPHSDS